MPPHFLYLIACLARRVRPTIAFLLEQGLNIPAAGVLRVNQALSRKSSSVVVLFAIAANDLARDGADDQAAFLLEALSRAGYGKERWERSEKKPIWLAWIDAMDELEVLKDAVPDELQRQAFAQAVVLFAKDAPIERVDGLHGMLSNLLLIRLFQQAPRCRVGRGPAAVSEESASVSGGVRDRGGLPEVPGCLSLARRVPLSSVWASAGLDSRAETTVAVRGVSTPGLVDVGNGAPQYEDPADGLVLGCVPDDN